MRISDWSSDVCSSDLMSLDHDSGTLDGTVLQGPFRGRRLSELSQGELVSLLGECRVEDDQSAVILEARKSVVSGKSVSVRVDLGGRRILKKKTIHSNLCKSSHPKKLSTQTTTP